MLMGYSGSTTGGAEGIRYGMPGIEPDRLHTRQVPYMQYYHSDLLNIFLRSSNLGNGFIPNRYNT